MDKTAESLVKSVKAAEKEFVSEIKRAKEEVVKANERIRKMEAGEAKFIDGEEGFAQIRERYGL